MRSDDKLSTYLISITYGVCLFVLLTNIDHVVGGMRMILKILTPVTTGGLMAFVLNVPMKKVENAVENFERKIKVKKFRDFRVPALCITLLVAVGILYLVFREVVPQIAASITQVLKDIQKVLPDVRTKLEEWGVQSNYVTMDQIVAWEETLMSTLKSGVGTTINRAVGSVSTIAGRVGNLALASIFMIYFLLDKERVADHASWLLNKILPKPAADALIGSGRLLNETYSKFFNSQCIEAVILGGMIFVGFTVFRLPYAMLVAILTAVTSFIPYIGSYLSCAVAVILTLMISPWQALLAFIVYQGIQFCENQFVYPRVVGGAVGLPPLYTLLAVFLGGALFGVIGMIFFIPITATVYTMLQNLRRRERQEMKAETAEAAANAGSEE